MGEKSTCRFLVENPEGKGPGGGPTHRWEGNLQTNIKEIGWEGVGWIHWFRVGAGGGLF
jgi:hypothetical protein